MTDGFTGNVVLKTMEGLAVFLLGEVRDAVRSTLLGRVGGLLIRPPLRRMRDRIDPETYGGAVLLGVRGLAVIGHGNSTGRGIANAVRVAARGTRGRLVEQFGAALGPGGRRTASRPRRIPAPPVTAVRPRPCVSCPARPERPLGMERQEGDVLDREKAVEEVRAILVEQLGVDPAEVTVESSFQEDLNADSLDLVELIMEMEDRFKIKIPDEEAEKIATVGQAVDYVLANTA